MTSINYKFPHVCRCCGLSALNIEQLQFFVSDKNRLNGRVKLCKECHKDKYKQEKGWVKSKYNITPEEYVQYMKTSDCCEICGSIDNLCYDHDHITMKFRGVLCRSCNKAIGQLGDTEESLQKALAYLQK